MYTTETILRRGSNTLFYIPWQATLTRRPSSQTKTESWPSRQRSLGSFDPYLFGRSPRRLWRTWRTIHAVRRIEMLSSRYYLQIISIWQEDWEKGSLGGAVVTGGTASEEEASTRSLVATLRATKLISQGMPILTCYRNTSSGSTTSQLARERETLDKMFSCACCLCKGLCGTPRSKSLSTAPPFHSASRDEGGTRTAGGQQAAQATTGERTQQEKCPSIVKARTGQEQGVGPEIDSSTPPILLPGQMQFLFTKATYASQPIQSLDSQHAFVFEVQDYAYPLQTSSVVLSGISAMQSTGYRSLEGTNWVCGETITSPLHIIARAQG